MTDLQDTAVRVGGGNQAIGGLEIGRDGFLHKHVDTGVEKFDTDRGMVLGGNGDDSGLDAPCEFGGVGESFAAVFPRDGLSAVGVLVDNGDEFGARETIEHTRVLLAEGADADDGDGDGAGGRFFTHSGG